MLQDDAIRILLYFARNEGLHFFIQKTSPGGMSLRDLKIVSHPHPRPTICLRISLKSADKMVGRIGAMPVDLIIIVGCVLVAALFSVLVDIISARASKKRHSRLKLRS